MDGDGFSNVATSQAAEYAVVEEIQIGAAD